MQNAGAPGSAAFGHQLPDHVRVPGVQAELWKAVNFLMSIRDLDFHPARFLCHYVFALVVTSEMCFVFISVPSAQKQCENFIVAHSLLEIMCFKSIILIMLSIPKI